jgi:type I restriction enzyme R subunit
VNTPHGQDIRRIICSDCVVLSLQRHGGGSGARQLYGLAAYFVRFYDFMSQIINRFNEVFVTDQLTGKDMVNYAYTIRDKVGENIKEMMQIENNSAEQALLGDFSKANDDAILDSSDAHQNQIMQLLADPSKAANFARIVFDLLVQGQAGNR